MSGLEEAARTSIADLDREYTPHLLPLSFVPPKVFYCSPDCEGPQTLADWHILLFTLVILLHLEQSVWRMTLAELLLPQHVVSAWKG